MRCVHDAKPPYSQETEPLAHDREFGTRRAVPANRAGEMTSPGGVLVITYASRSRTAMAAASVRSLAWSLRMALRRCVLIVSSDRPR